MITFIGSRVSYMDILWDYVSALHSAQYLLVECINEWKSYNNFLFKFEELIHSIIRE